MRELGYDNVSSLTGWLVAGKYVRNWVIPVEPLTDATPSPRMLLDHALSLCRWPHRLVADHRLLGREDTRQADAAHSLPSLHDRRSHHVHALYHLPPSPGVTDFARRQRDRRIRAWVRTSGSKRQVSLLRPTYRKLIISIQDCVSEERMAVTSGHAMIGLALGSVCGPAIGGALYDHLGYYAPWIFSICLVSMVGCSG